MGEQLAPNPDETVGILGRAALVTEEESSLYIADQAAESGEQHRQQNAEDDPNGATRQMGISSADRLNREAAGLPPRVYDLR